MSVPEVITVDGVKYVRRAPVDENGLPYRIVRCRDAGVFAGFVESADDVNGVYVVRQARRLWYWSGAASLSQLALEGVKNPKDCKFPAAMDRVKLLGVVEVLEPTEQARVSIDGVPVWKV